MSRIADWLGGALADSELPFLTGRFETISHAEARRNISRIIDRFDIVFNAPPAVGDRVVLALDLSPMSIQVVLALLASGLVYVPVDPRASETDIQRLVSLVRPRAIIAEGSIAPSSSIMTVSGAALLGNNSRASRPRSKRVIATDLASITFTSGSTGEPKGVMVTHGAIENFVDSVMKTFRHGPGVVSLCRTPPTFDPFLTEVLPSFASGGCVAVQPRMVTTRALLRFMSEFEVGNLGCGPALLEEIAACGEYAQSLDLSSLREVYIGYEKVHRPTVDRIQRLLPHAELINGYGTTETFAASSFYRIPDLTQSRDEIPIGDPIDGCRFVLVDAGGDTFDGDGVGELVVTGVGLMRGYWGMPEATAARLKRVPVDDPNAPMGFWTGDLVERMNGEIFFLGRRDNQVKVNGYRVELEGVRNTLISALPSFIRDCAVIDLPGGILAALVEPGEVEGVEPDELRRLARQYLLPQFLPSIWLLGAIPRTDNSKIDLEACRLEVQSRVERERNAR